MDNVTLQFKLKMDLTIAKANWEAGKNQLESVKLAIAEGRSDVRSPSHIAEEMAFYSGRVNALEELLNYVDEYEARAERKARIERNAKAR